MFTPFADAGHSGHFEVTGSKQGHPVSLPEGLDATHQFDGRHVNICGPQFDVDIQLCLQVCRFQSRVGVIHQVGAELFEFSGLQGTSCGCGMAAVRRQQMGAGTDAIVDIICRDAARRAHVDAIAQDVGEDHGGSVKRLGQIAGNESDDSKVPLLPQHTDQPFPFQHVVGDQSLCLPHALLLHLLPLAIEPVQLLGESSTLFGILRAQQGQGDVRFLQAAGNIESGAEKERQCRCVHGPPVAARHDAQFLQSRSFGALHNLQAIAHEHTILLQQGNHVGHRAEGDEIEQIIQVPAPVIAGDQRLTETLHDLEGDANARQPLEGVAAIPAIRIDDAVCRGQILVLSMVVDDDHVDPTLARQMQSFECRNAIVDSDDEAGTKGNGFVHTRGLEAIAVDMAVRQEKMAPSPDVLQKIEHQGGAAHTVDVVIAVYDDRFVPTHGTLDALGAALQIREQFRRVQGRRQARPASGHGSATGHQAGNHTRPRGPFATQGRCAFADLRGNW